MSHSQAIGLVSMAANVLLAHGYNILIRICQEKNTGAGIPPQAKASSLLPED